MELASLEKNMIHFLVFFFCKEFNFTISYIQPCGNQYNIFGYGGKMGGGIKWF